MGLGNKDNTGMDCHRELYNSCVQITPHMDIVKLAKLLPPIRGLTELDELEALENGGDENIAKIWDFYVQKCMLAGLEPDQEAAHRPGVTLSQFVFKINTRLRHLCIKTNPNPIHERASELFFTFDPNEFAYDGLEEHREACANFLPQSNDEWLPSCGFFLNGNHIDTSRIVKAIVQRAKGYDYARFPSVDCGVMPFLEFWVTTVDMPPAYYHMSKCFKILQNAPSVLQLPFHGIQLALKGARGIGLLTLGEVRVLTLAVTIYQYSCGLELSPDMSGTVDVLEGTKRCMMHGAIGSINSFFLERVDPFLTNLRRNAMRVLQCVGLPTHAFDHFIDMERMRIIAVQLSSIFQMCDVSVVEALENFFGSEEPENPTCEVVINAAPAGIRTLFTVSEIKNILKGTTKHPTGREPLCEDVFDENNRYFPYVDDSDRDDLHDALEVEDDAEEPVCQHHNPNVNQNASRWFVRSTSRTLNGIPLKLKENQELVRLGDLLKRSKTLADSRSLRFKISRQLLLQMFGLQTVLEKGDEKSMSSFLSLKLMRRFIGKFYRDDATSHEDDNDDRLLAIHCGALLPHHSYVVLKLIRTCRRVIKLAYKKQDNKSAAYSRAWYFLRRFHSFCTCSTGECRKASRKHWGMGEDRMPCRKLTNSAVQRKQIRKTIECRSMIELPSRNLFNSLTFDTTRLGVIPEAAAHELSQSLRLNVLEENGKPMPPKKIPKVAQPKPAKAAPKAVQPPQPKQPVQPQVPKVAPPPPPPDDDPDSSDDEGGDGNDEYLNARREEEEKIDAARGRADARALELIEVRERLKQRFCGSNVNYVELGCDLKEFEVRDGRVVKKSGNAFPVNFVNDLVTGACLVAGTVGSIMQKSWWGAVAGAGCAAASRLMRDDSEILAGRESFLIGRNVQPCPATDVRSTHHRRDQLTDKDPVLCDYVKTTEFLVRRRALLDIGTGCDCDEWGMKCSCSLGYRTFIMQGPLLEDADGSQISLVFLEGLLQCQVVKMALRNGSLNAQSADVKSNIEMLAQRTFSVNIPADSKDSIMLSTMKVALGKIQELRRTGLLPGFSQDFH